ncbi:response regulator containing a CheY-like receiver domain and an HTH DNA-binding domain [Xenococcus sp. PCC 7305]|uniref:response regulator n=1 Tax=Xenococcus sp. PCC 7305 TaxID=102125 RepID=UPI0002ACF7CA|nr:response regulator transcription factor [Xenococcus sp. PCC 7305]ELS03321.1 response regulator containing a CheY-like receiver domain and an HTH DNA-binding domain [Xenococcus sp. PCC 7305]
MINILLVDDQELLCEVLKTWLQEESDLKVVGVAKNGKEGISKIEMLQPDIVLMDIDMPEMDGLNAAQIISDRFPEVKVIFLSGHEEDDYLGKSLRTGAKGYLLKNTTAKELVTKIRNVHDSNSIVAPGDNGEILTAMHAQLEELLKTYKQKFQKQFKKYQEYQELQEELALSEGEIPDQEQQFKLLEEQLATKQKEHLRKFQADNQSSWEAVKNEITKVTEKLTTDNQNLQTQVNQQIVGVEQKLQTQLAQAEEKLTAQKDQIQPHLDEIESTYRKELKLTIDPICTSFLEIEGQLNNMRDSIEKIEPKYHQELIAVVNPIRSSIQDFDEQIQKMRTWLIAAVLVAAVSISFSSWALISAGNSSSGSETTEATR